MKMNIHNIKLDEQKDYLLTCPQCEQSFETTKDKIKSAISHKQSNMFCSAQCARDNRRLSKDDLAYRILSFYFEHGQVPRFEDFDMSSIYRRVFGNWTKAIQYCGLDDLKIEPKKDNRNTWARQKERYLTIKKNLVKKKGGRCESCGYDKNLAVLQFHHIDPTMKEISLDARSMGNISMDRLDKEVEKCQLLCANCHLDHHNPHLRSWF